MNAIFDIPQRTGWLGTLSAYGLLMLIAAGLPACSLLQPDLEPPTVSLVSITPESATISRLAFRCRLRLDNPNDVGLPIKGGEILLSVANRDAARGRLADDFTLPPGGAELVDAIVTVDVMSAIGILAGIIENPNAALRYDLDGYVDVGISRLGRVRFDESGEFSPSGPSTDGRRTL